MNHLVKLLIIPSLLLSYVSQAASVPARKGRTLVVAVIDTGIADDLADAKFLCNSGHKDFTGTGLTDHLGHGTHISGLIDQYVKNLVLDKKIIPVKKIIDTYANYCQVILKWYDPTLPLADSNKQEEQAFQRAIDLEVDVINFSGGGTSFSLSESLLIKKALDMGIIVVVAAGNENSDLDKAPFYPAVLDKRLYVVGNLSRDSSRSPLSNYGVKVNTWEYGTRRTSYGLDQKVAIYTGTSQATAVKSGKLIREMLNSK